MAPLATTRWVFFIRQEDHPLFGDLAAVLNTEMGGTVMLHSSGRRERPPGDRATRPRRVL